MNRSIWNVLSVVLLVAACSGSEPETEPLPEVPVDALLVDLQLGNELVVGTYTDTLGRVSAGTSLEFVQGEKVLSTVLASAAHEANAERGVYYQRFPLKELVVDTTTLPHKVTVGARLRAGDVLGPTKSATFEILPVKRDVVLGPLGYGVFDSEHLIVNTERRLTAFIRGDAGSFTFGDSAHLNVTTPRVFDAWLVNDEVIFLRTSEGIEARSQTTGMEQLWTLAGGSFAGAADGRLFLTTFAEEAVLQIEECNPATGAKLWTVTTPGFNYELLGDVTLHDGEVRFLTKHYNNENGHDLTAWTVPTPFVAPVPRKLATFASGTLSDAVLLAGGDGVFVTEESGVQRVLSWDDGAELWKETLPGNIRSDEVRYDAALGARLLPGAIEAFGATGPTGSRHTLALANWIERPRSFARGARLIEQYENGRQLTWLNADLSPQVRVRFEGVHSTVAATADGTAYVLHVAADQTVRVAELLSPAEYLALGGKP